MTNDLHEDIRDTDDESTWRFKASTVIGFALSIISTGIIGLTYWVFTLSSNFDNFRLSQTQISATLATNQMAIMKSIPEINAMLEKMQCTLIEMKITENDLAARKGVR